MKTELQLIIARFRAQGILFRTNIGQPKVTVYNEALPVQALPERPQEDAFYLIDCSKLPEHPPKQGVYSLLCLEDTAAPEWLMSSACNVILTADAEAAVLLPEIALEFRRARLRYNEAMNGILDALYYSHGLNTLCDMASELLGNPVCMLDTSLKSLAVPKLYTTKVPTLRQAWDRGYSNNRDIRFLRSKGWFDPQCGSRTVAYFPHESFQEYDAWATVSGCCVGYVRANGVVIAYMLVAGENKEITDYEVNWVVRITQLASLEMQKALDNRTGTGGMYAALLVDLLDGQITDPFVIQSRSQLLGIAASKYYFVTTVRKQNRGQKSTDFSSVEQRRMRNMFPNTISARYHGDLVLISGTDVRGNPFLGREEELNHKLSTSGLVIGISNLFTELSEVRKFYTQSILALEYGRKFCEEGTVFPYFKYAIYHAVELCTRETDMWQLCHPVLKELRISPTTSDKDLFHTLYLYLLYNRDVTRICKVMSIHRSTLFYRLNKIKTQLNLDLDDGNTVLHLMFSYKIIEYMNGLKDQSYQPVSDAAIPDLWKVERETHRKQKKPAEEPDVRKR